MKTCSVPGCKPAHDCRPDQCQRCEEGDVGERLAIQMGSAPVDSKAWQKATQHILESCRPGQRELAV